MKQSKDGNESKNALAYRFKVWMEEYEYNHDGEKLTKSDIAEKASITEYTLSRKINGFGEFSAKEIIAIAKVFNISCDEFLTGTSFDNKTAGQSYGLKQKALEQLKQMNKTEPNLISVLDILLGNQYIADSLLRMFLTYAENPMLKLSPLTSNNEEEFIYLNDKRGDTLIKTLLFEIFEQTLNDFKNEWGKHISTFRKMTFTQKTSRNMKKHLDEESILRLRKKHIAMHIKPALINHYWKMKDNMAKYAIFKHLIDQESMQAEKNHV